MKKILKYGFLAAAGCLLAVPASAALVSIQEVDIANGMSTGGLVLPVDSRTEGQDDQRAIFGSL